MFFLGGSKDFPFIGPWVRNADSLAESEPYLLPTQIDDLPLKMRFFIVLPRSSTGLVSFAYVDMPSLHTSGVCTCSNLRSDPLRSVIEKRPIFASENTTDL